MRNTLFKHSREYANPYFNKYFQAINELLHLDYDNGYANASGYYIIPAFSILLLKSNRYVLCALKY